MSSPGSFSGLPYAPKANADWMSALNSQLWDVPLHQLSIPGEAPRARLSGKAAARRSVCAKPQCQTCTHAGTHTCMHTHTHTTHTCTHTHRTHMHTGIHAHTVHTHIHTPAPSLLSPLYPHSTWKVHEPRRGCLQDTWHPGREAGGAGGGGCRAFSASDLLPGTPGNFSSLTFAPTFSIRARAARSALEPGGPKV